MMSMLSTIHLFICPSPSEYKVVWNAYDIVNVSLELWRQTNSSIVLVFLNPTSQLRRTDVTNFCMQLENRLLFTSYCLSPFSFPYTKVTPSLSPMVLPL